MSYWRCARRCRAHTRLMDAARAPDRPHTPERRLAMDRGELDLARRHYGERPARPDDRHAHAMPHRSASWRQRRRGQCWQPARRTTSPARGLSGARGRPGSWRRCTADGEGWLIPLPSCSARWRNPRRPPPRRSWYRAVARQRRGSTPACIVVLDARRNRRRVHAAYRAARGGRRRCRSRCRLYLPGRTAARQAAAEGRVLRARTRPVPRRRACCMRGDAMIDGELASASATAEIIAPMPQR